MVLEIERKFILETLPDNIEEYKHEPIRQGYISITECETVRIRQKGEKYWLTVKRGKGLSREEYEVELFKEQFETLWITTKGKQLEKVRYYLPYGTYTIEIDVFGGSLASLLFAEVEFSSEDEANLFTPLDFMGREVTLDGGYTNASLVLNGLPSTVD